LDRIAQRLAPLVTAATVAAGFMVAPPLAWAKTLRIVIENVAFGPALPDARVGDVVDWVNKDFVAHTATARDGSFDVVLPPGKTVALRLRHAGTISFYCRYHPNMTGAITVAP
jgi:plastocyanin